jgi:hypothetical protein
MAAGDAALSEVDMRLAHIALQPLIRQLVGDGVGGLIDAGAEQAVRDRRDCRCHFVAAQADDDPIVIVAREGWGGIQRAADGYSDERSVVAVSAV